MEHNDKSVTEQLASIPGLEAAFGIPRGGSPIVGISFFHENDLERHLKTLHKQFTQDKYKRQSNKESLRKINALERNLRNLRRTLIACSNAALQLGDLRYKNLAEFEKNFFSHNYQNTCRGHLNDRLIRSEVPLDYVITKTRRLMKVHKKKGAHKIIFDQIISCFSTLNLKALNTKQQECLKLAIRQQSRVIRKRKKGGTLRKQQIAQLSPRKKNISQL